ncbi:MAG: hypothetical protein V1772_13775 [Chloroflexota bacterium]
MRVRQIDTHNAHDVRRFVRFPFALYRGSPYWVPPLLADARQILDEDHHPYYQHSAAAFFLAERDGEVVGRIAAMDNRPYNAHYRSKVASFGYLETINDEAVARALFDACAAWAAARGLTEMYGARELLGVDTSGILVEGFDQLPALGVPYNPPYYDSLVRAAGFEKVVDALGGYISGDAALPERFERIAAWVRRRAGLHIKSFAPGEDLRPWVPHVTRIFDVAFAHNRDWYPLSPAEMEHIAARMITLVDPRLSKLVMKDDQVVGFALLTPNFGRGLQRARGHLWPLGWWHIQRDRRRTRRLDGSGVGLLPAYQGVGADALLFSELAKTIKHYGYQHIDLVHVGEDNFRSRSDQEAVGVRWYKRHRIYRREI